VISQTLLPKSTPKVLFLLQLTVLASCSAHSLEPSPVPEPTQHISKLPAGPQGKNTVRTSCRGTSELVFLIDQSRSTEEDILPATISVLSKEIPRLRTNVVLTIIGFNKHSYAVVRQLTMNEPEKVEAVNRLRRLIPVFRTKVHAAMFEALKILTSSSASCRELILISDGKIEDIETVSQEIGDTPRDSIDFSVHTFSTTKPPALPQKFTTGWRKYRFFEASKSETFQKNLSSDLCTRGLLFDGPCKAGP
jgi:hypothetical protein